MAKHKRLKPIGDYLFDKGEMIEQMFSSIPIVEIRNMVPIKLQGMPLHELKAECLVELLGISDREILNILNGKKERSVSSSDSEHEDAFVISDDEKKIAEKRIKKEKKDSVRKIKTERVSSKKDSTSRSSLERSTPKKKRKSKEVVEVNSKKKKSIDKPAVISSSSRDASKLPVCKKKKGEKKKDSSKKKEEDIVVVLDDSDKEEKREQKSLLDLLELEMRARAIRSLLKKEEAIQAQKILSEYKDEPDDLIPVEIEPPQIELLSDSEGEETTVMNVEAQGNLDTEKTNEGISLKQPEDLLHSSEGHETSRPPPDGPNDDSASVLCAIEKMTTSDRNEIAEKSAPKSGRIEDKGEKSGKIISSDHNDSIQSTLSGDVMSFKVTELAEFPGSTSHCSIASKQQTSSCVSKGGTVEKDSAEQDASKIHSLQGPDKSESTSSLSEDSRNKIGTGHFLVIEEPSDFQAADGSEIEESSVEMSKINIETKKPPSSKSSDEDEVACSNENVDSSTVHEGFQLPTVVESPPFHSNSDVGNEESVLENSRAVWIANEEDGSNCCLQVKGYRCPNSHEVKVALHTPTVRCESFDKIAEDELPSHFEDEVLDYDYDPLSSYCEKGSEVTISQSETSIGCMANCKTLPSEKDIGIHNYSSVLYPYSNDVERKPEKLESSYQAREDCDVGKLETRADECDNSCENHVHSSDALSSVAINSSLNETASDNCSITENLTHPVFKDDSSQSFVNCNLSSNQLETVKMKEEGRSDDFSSELSEDYVAFVSFNVSDTKARHSIQQYTCPNEAEQNLSKEIVGHHKDNYNDTHGEEIHSCPSIQPPVNVDKSECSKEERDVCHEQAGCYAQIHMTSEEDLALKLTGFHSGSAELTKKGLPDNSLVSEENVSIADKDEIQIPSSCSSSVEASAYPVIQESSTIRKMEQDERQLSEHSLPIRADELDALISTVSGQQITAVPQNGNVVDTSVVDSRPKTNDGIIESGQSSKCSSSVIASCAYKSSNTTSFQSRLVPSSDIEIIEAQVTKMSETLPTSSQDLIIVDVAEVIDITEGDHIESSDVVCISEERVDSDSVDESDNDISDKAALILAQMSNILSGEVDRMGEISSDESCQPSPHPTSGIPAEVYSVNSNSGSSGHTDDGSEDDVSPKKEYNAVVEVSDVDDADEEETKDEGTSESGDDNGSSASLGKSSIEIIDDSESICSVESQQDDSRSDDCVMVLPPDGSISDDCIVVTELAGFKNSSRTVFTEPTNSESDICAKVSQHDGIVMDESAKVSHFESTHSKSAENSSTTIDRNNVVVTVIIEDDDGGEEEVQLLTEEVPAEILELDDEDEVKTNWTARWLESDNVKKVVQTSKILTNVRKQMKMKLKKIEAPINPEPKPPEEKSAPLLIGSVEEYHRLVKEGVIFSKATQNDGKDDSSNKKDPINSPEKSIDSISAKSAVEGGHKKKLDSIKPEKKKKSDKSERKQKSERKRKSGKHEMNKSVLNCSVAEFSSNPDTREADRMNEKSAVLAVGEAAEELEAREDGEIIECSNSKLPLFLGGQPEENETIGLIIGEVVSGVCHAEQYSKNDKDREREDGETSEKEEGEISDSDCEGGSKESQKPEPCSSIKANTESRECRSGPPLPSIPLPQKPPVKPQRPPTKNPERNSVAKRFILRNLQLSKKRLANPKNKKKRKKGAGRGNKKGLGYSSNVAPKKNKPATTPQLKRAYETPQSQKGVVNSLSSTSDLLQTVPGVQPSYTGTHPGLAQPGSSVSQLGQTQNTCLTTSNPGQMYDSYYSWAYSQGLISSANGNYGYGTPQSTPDPNVYKQWEEYYRKLMEACKVSAEHASAGTLYNLPSTLEKSGYTWVFDHSTSTSQTSQIPASGNSTAEPAVQVQAASIPSENSQVIQSVAPVIDEMSDQDRFESWQYRYGLKGLLKEHFIPAPTTPSGDGARSHS